MVVDGGDDSFKRPGAVPFNWEIRPGVPKTRPADGENCDDDDDYPTLLLPPLRLKPLPPPSNPAIADYKPRTVSPFAPPPLSIKLKSPPDRDSPHCSGPPPPSDPPIDDYKPRTVSHFAPPPSPIKLKPPPNPDSPHFTGPPAPYFRSYSRRDELGSGSSRWRFLKSLFASKKSKNRHESTSPESDNFYESETAFSPSEDSSRGSVSTRWSSPKSSLSSLRGSPMKRNQSDLSSYEKKTIIMIARDRLA